MNDDRESAEIEIDALVRGVLDRSASASSFASHDECAVLSRIGGRSPREVNAEIGSRRLRNATVVAAGLLVSLVVAAHRGKTATFGAGDDDVVQSLFAVDSSDTETAASATPDRLVADLFNVEVPE